MDTLQLLHAHFSGFVEVLITGNGDVIFCVFVCVYFCIQTCISFRINSLYSQKEEIPSTRELYTLKKKKKGMNRSNGWELKQDKFKLEIRHTFLIGSIIIR